MQINLPLLIFLTEFLKYKIDKPLTGGLSASMTGLSRLSGGISGMLWVHLLAGRGLRPSPPGGSPASPPSGPLAPPQQPVPSRDLYCVLECDRVHKARTVVGYLYDQLEFHVMNYKRIRYYIKLCFRYVPESFSSTGMSHLN